MKENNIHIDDDLLMAFLLGEADNEQIVAIKKWLEISDENSKYFKELEKVWLGTLNITQKPVAVDIDKAWNNVEKQLKSEPKIIKNKTRTFVSYVMRIAAVLLIFFGIFMLLKSVNQPNMTTIAATDSILIDTLTDGSIISLNENSNLIFPDEFDKNQRLVKLEGEAFFEIAHNSEQPFIIDANGGFIQVIGTKFNVNTNSDSLYITVFVEEGVVKLFNTQPDSRDTLSVILTAGEKGRINTITGVPEKLQIIDENFNDLYWKTNILKFNSCNVSEAVKTLEEIFEVEIEISESAKNLKLSATFEDENLDQILEVIGLTFNLKITKNGKSYKIDVDE